MKRIVAIVMTCGLCLLGVGSSASAQPEKSLDKCQQTAGKVIGKYAAEVHKTVTKCLNAISKERVKNAAGNSAAAAGKCVSAFRKINNQEDSTKTLSAKAFVKLMKACDPSFNAELSHVEDDVLDADNSGPGSVSGDRLHAERLGLTCRVAEGIAGTGSAGRLGSVVEWTSCQLAAAERGALRQVHLEYTQGDFWLRDMRPTIDALAMQDDLKAEDALDVLGQVRRWVDLFDGTVYDRVTELTWEKKTDDSTIHDKDNTYTWSNATNDPDGTAFTTFLNTLNGGATGVGNCLTTDGLVQSGGFAGHCDWRLPTAAELQTILLEPHPCGTSPCIDEGVFGSTVASNYWSSSVISFHAEGAAFAWVVSFSDGEVDFDGIKMTPKHVRAVRGGL